MEKKTAREIQAELLKPFAPEDLEWRLQTAYEDRMRGVAVPYVTNRAIQSRLDEVVGPDNWYNEYKPWHGNGKKEAQICGISIYFEDRGFITKWDGAEDSDIEPVKGGLSDSMKRAAVQWGIGRILYSMDTVYVEIEKKGRSYVIKNNERSRLDNVYLAMLRGVGLTPAPAGGVQSLLIPRSAPEDMMKAESPANQVTTNGGGNCATSVLGSQQSATQPQATPHREPNSAVSKAVSQGTAKDYEYMVITSRIQKGMNSNSTMVVLENRDGERINAFVRDAHPELTAGVLLAGTRLEVKTQDTVVFRVLVSFQIVGRPQKAA